MAQNKKTVAELKNELYISTLIEKHQEDNFWLTSISKNEFESMRYSAMENAKKTASIKVASDVIDRLFPIYKETDLLLYLLLKYSISNVEHAKLNDQELSCAKGMILEEFDFNEEHLTIEIVAERLKEKFTSPVFANEKIKDIIVDICKNGVRCFEPFSHLLDHSERFVSSLEYAVVFKCLYSFILTNSEKEGVKSKFDLEYVPVEGTIEEQMAAFEQHHKDVEKAAEAYVIQNRIHIVDGVEKGSSSIPNIWQYANQEKYANALISFSSVNGYAINAAESDMLDIDAIRAHVEKNGFIVFLFDEKLMASIRSPRKDVKEKIAKLKDVLAKHPELDAYIPDNSLWSVVAYILKKDKKDQNVHVFYSVDSSKQTDYLYHGNDFLQCRIMTQADLAAIGYDLSKANMLPSIHASSGESFLSLSDLLAASKDAYVRLKQIAIGKVFTPDNYATSFDTFVVTSSSLRDAQVDDKWKKVSEPVFVIRQKPFAVAYVEASADQPVFFKEMTMTFSVKKDVVDPKYLYLLSTNGKLEQVVRDCPNLQFPFDGYTLYADDRGVAHCGFWPAKDLLCYKGLIAIPSLAKQKDLCESFEKSERRRLDRAAMSQYRQDIHERKHALGQIMLQMRSSWDALVFAKEENNGCIDDNYVYGKKHPHTIKHIFESIDSYMNELGTGIDTFTPEDNVIYQEKEQIYIKEYLEDYVKKHSNPCYDFEIVSDPTSSGKESFVFSRRALDTILQNLVFNAWKHGFVGRSQGNVIRLSWKEEEDTVLVFVSNNGIPMSDSMSNGEIFKFGKTTSIGQESVDGHHHLGLGCYQVWCLMRDKGQGDVFCISEPKKEFPVTFKLVFNK